MTPRRLGACLILPVCAALALAIGAMAGPPRPPGLPSAPPHRIMSTNMCNDLLLLMMVPKERIASITHLARDPVATLMPGADAGVAVNRGSAEEVVQQRPDLILVSPWSAPVLRRLAERTGARVLEIESANSFADIRRITRAFGATVGEPERAEALIAEMDRELAALERERPEVPIEIAAWNSGDAVPGAGTLTDEIIRAAGAVNLARRLPGSAQPAFGLEELLAARPDAIMRGVDGYDAPSLREAANEHPVIRKAFRGRRLTYPAALYACGLPQSAMAARQLRRALADIPPGDLAW